MHQPGIAHLGRTEVEGLQPGQDTLVVVGRLKGKDPLGNGAP